MELSTHSRQAYSELDEFLELLSIEQRNMIPQKLREIFKQEKDKEYVKGIDPSIPIKEQNLKEETLGLIALLNLQYWCQDEVEKEKLKKIYSDNEKKYQEMLRTKFNPDNIFNKKEITLKNESKEEQSLQIVTYTEPLFKRIVNKILQFFKIN